MVNREVVWTVADRLAKARKDAGLTQQELAEWCGLSLHTVSNYENPKHKSTPNRAVRMAWAARCGVSLEFLNGTADLGVHASGWISEYVAA